jgi:ketosteroid isomerase-like protein
MSHANVDALRAVYAEWGKGNWRPRFAVYDEAMEWGWSPEFPGLAGVRRDERLPNPRLREWLSQWEHWQCAAERYIEHGEHVIVLARYTGRSKGGSVPVDVEGAHVWTMRDGRAIRLEIFSDRELALRSVGLEG